MVDGGCATLRPARLLLLVSSLCSPVLAGCSPGGNAFQPGAVRHTNSCHLTVVALKDGKPAQVPRLICRTREDKMRYIQAKMRRELGLKYREETSKFLQQFDGMDDAELDALIEGNSV